MIAETNIFLFDGSHGNLTRLKLFDGIFDRKEWLTDQTYCNYGFCVPPQGPGVYAFVQEWIESMSEGERFDPVVLYVGMSMNLAKRCSKEHPIWRTLGPEHEYARRYFRPIPKSDVREVERCLIKAFKPRFNLALNPQRT